MLSQYYISDGVVTIGPPPGDLGSTDRSRLINPLLFLARNILCNNALIIACNTQSFGVNPLNVSYDSFFRRVVPPQSMIFLVMRIAMSDTVTAEVVTPLTTPGYDETLDPTLFVCPDPMAEDSPDAFVSTETFAFTTIAD